MAKKYGIMDSDGSLQDLNIHNYDKRFQTNSKNLLRVQDLYRGTFENSDGYKIVVIKDYKEPVV